MRYTRCAIDSRAGATAHVNNAATAAGRPLATGPDTIEVPHDIARRQEARRQPLWTPSLPTADTCGICPGPNRPTAPDMVTCMIAWTRPTIPVTITPTAPK